MAVRRSNERPVRSGHAQVALLGGMAAHGALLVDEGSLIGVVPEDRGRRRPVLEPAAIATILATEYGIAATAVVPETSGHDAVTRAWRVATGTSEHAFFLKARPADSRLEVAGRIAVHLRDRGFREVVAPIATRDGSVPGAGRASRSSRSSRARAMDVGLGDADWEAPAGSSAGP
jgi:hypothetical protein